MSKRARRCRDCKGTGTIIGVIDNIVCPKCEGTGITLRTVIEEQFDDATELEGTKIHEDEVGFIEFEEDDYEI